MEQKVIITDSQSDINNELNKGWKIVSVTPQHVANGTNSFYEVRGKFCFVLEKT
jgi:hypothetical protein